LKREALIALGLLSEDYFFFLEETDWCLRAQRAGWRVVFVPDASAVHQLGASSKRVDPLATRIEYQRSLDHFLRVHRGAATARAVRAIRMVKSLGSLLLLAVPAAFSERARRRAAERLGALRWYFAGRLDEGGLAAQVDPECSLALDEASETREDSPRGISDPVRGDG
jgi:GT2 family glycosyltransferase